MLGLEVFFAPGRRAHAAHARVVPERAGGARGARAYLAAEHLHGLLLGGFGVHLESEGACVWEGGRGSEAVLGMVMVEEASRGGRGSSVGGKRLGRGDLAGRVLEQGRPLQDHPNEEILVVPLHFTR